ncbi:MAG: asparagine synthase-related protein [Phycisphaeraceae bacterium]
MPDFIAVFDPGDKAAERAERALQERPGMGDLPVRRWHFPWGWVSVQRARCFGYEPYEEAGQVYFTVGRPRVQGWRHEDEGPTGFTQHVAKLVHTEAVGPLYEQLTGMFVLVGCNDEGLTLFTDPMGLYAVYEASAPSGQRRVLGTASELVADFANRGGDYDPVSLAEILVQNVVTFPYTTRRGMRELEPGSRHTRRLTAGAGVQSEASCLWQPSEPKQWPSLRQSQAELRSALRTAGEDLTRGAEAVAVTLSGGTDSRTVLSCVPPEKRSQAVTYADHENTEIRTAGQVAQAAGVPHHLALRTPHFYAELAERETKLLGIERGFVNSHGFALVDTPAPAPFDLLVCGHMSDTLLKGYYAGLRRRGFWDLLKHPLAHRRKCRQPYLVSTPQYQTNLNVIRPALRDAIQRRWQERIKTLEAVRPTSAAEWIYFYPLSRRSTIAYTQANVRLFASDQLFLHASVIAVACSARQSHKVIEAITGPVFGQLNGALARITNANTGRPPAASLRQIMLDRIKKRVGRLFRGEPGKPRTGGARPWYTEASWVDYHALQSKSEVWRDLAETAAAHRAMFDEVLEPTVQQSPLTYHPWAGTSFNYNLVRLPLAHAAAVERRAAGEVYVRCDAG